MSSKALGSGLASLSAFIFLYYTVWVFITVRNIQPFVNPDHWIQEFFLDRRWAVRIPQILLLLVMVTVTALSLATTCCEKRKKTL
jgi:dolichol phosphate-mannose biosynthesis regulatory protein